MLPMLIPHRILNRRPRLHAAMGTTAQWTDMPTFLPTYVPSLKPTNIPTRIPSLAPSPIPSFVPTDVPSLAPSNTPSNQPSATPTDKPSRSGPTPNPTLLPTTPYPTLVPTTAQPTAHPTIICKKMPFEVMHAKCTSEMAQLADQVCSLTPKPLSSKAPANPTPSYPDLASSPPAVALTLQPSIPRPPNRRPSKPKPFTP